MLKLHHLTRSPLSFPHKKRDVFYRLKSESFIRKKNSQCYVLTFLGETKRTFMKSKSKKLILMCCIASMSFHSKAGPLKMDEAVARALANNPTVTAELSKLRATEARAQRDALPPQFIMIGEVENFAGNEELQGFRSAETTVRVGRTIELGGKREARKKLGSAESREQENHYLHMRLLVARMTKTRFIEILSHQQRAVIARERVRQAENTREEVARWVTAGRNPSSDLQAAEIALIEAELNRESIEHELESAKVALAACWGALTPDFSEVAGDLQQLPPTPSLEELTARLARSPESQAAFLRVETLAARKRVVSAESNPNVDLSVGIRRFGATGERAVVAAFSVPLGGAVRARYSIAQANAELSAIQARNDADRLTRHQELFDKYMELAHARSEFETLRSRLLPMAESALTTTRLGFEKGRFSFVALSAAQQTLFNLHARANDAAIRYRILQVEVDHLTATNEEIAP
jgi:cobalt-zinc-cadmium efflux system outer membrane protein